MLNMYGYRSQDLDNYITGHYGEDQFREPLLDLCELCGEEFTDTNPPAEMYDPSVEESDSVICHMDCGKAKGLEVA